MSEEKYVDPNIEFELSKEKRQTCRDIVLEIRKFGVSQRQMLYLIRLLAMELEDGETMKVIVAECGDKKGRVKLVKEDKPKPKLSKGEEEFSTREKPVGKKLLLS